MNTNKIISAVNGGKLTYKFFILFVFLITLVTISFIKSNKLVSAACTAPATTYGTDTMTINIPSTTTYNIWVRLQIPDSTNNTIMMQIDGGTCYNVGADTTISPNTWTWVDYQNGSSTQHIQPSLTAGNHSIELIGVNPGVSVDKILALSDTTCTPTGTAPPGSPCEPLATPLPSTPTGLVASATNASQVDLTWNASTDVGGPGIGGYYILRGGIQIANVTSGTTYQDKTVSPSTKYSYTIESYDTSSPVNISTVSSASIVTTPAATIPPPTAPGSLAATALSSTSVGLTWSASTDVGGPGIGGYYIYRDGTKIGNAAAAATNYTDKTVSQSTSYAYTIKSYDTSTPVLMSSVSIIANATTPATPAPTTPTNVSTNPDSYKQVTISWSASTDVGGPGVGGYYIYRDGTQVGSATSAATSYIDFSVSASTAYAYTVKAFDKSQPAVLSTASSSSSVTTPAAPTTPAPTTPTNVSTNAISSTQINVRWNASTDTGGPGLGGYYVIRDGTTIAQVSNSTISYSDTGLNPSTSYSYIIESYDTSTPVIVSNPSTTSTVNTPNGSDTIAPSQPTNMTAATISGNQINLSWTASTDNVGVANYTIYRDGVKLVTLSGTTYGDSSLASSTQYTYYVFANDAAGNVSIQSTSASATTLDITQAYTYVYGTITNSSGSPVSFALARTIDDASVTTGLAVQAYTNVLGQYLLPNLRSYTYHSFSYNKTGLSTKSLYLKWPAGRIQMNETI